MLSFLAAAVGEGWTAGQEMPGTTQTQNSDPVIDVSERAGLSVVDFAVGVVPASVDSGAEMAP